MSKNAILQELEDQHLKKDAPLIHVGDTVAVTIRVKEGDKVRFQKHQGIVTEFCNKGNIANFTIRKLSGGYGVNLSYNIHSDMVEKIETLRTGKVRQSRLQYLRGTAGKAAKVKELGRKRTSFRKALKQPPVKAEAEKQPEA